MSSCKQDSSHIYDTTTTKSNRVLTCGVVWILGKHKKPFSDAEILKECMTEVMDTMFKSKQGRKRRKHSTMYFNLCQNGNDIILVRIFLVVLNEKDILF